MTPRRWATVGAGATLLVIAVLTLIPGSETISIPPLCPFCDEYALTDVILNILLFVPLGFFFGACGWTRRRAVWSCFAITVTIESLQIVIPGRDASIRDALMNTLGGWIGCWLFASAVRLVWPSPTEAKSLLWKASLLWTAILVVSTWLLIPSMPHSQYFGMWAPRLRGYEPFVGRVLEVTAGGAALQDGKIPDTENLRDRLVRTASISAVAEPGPPTKGVAPVAAVYDEWRRQVIFLAQDGDALEFTVRRNAAMVGLRNITMRLRGVFPPEANATPSRSLEIWGVASAGRVTLGRAVRGAERIEHSTVLSAAFGWLFLLPFAYHVGPSTDFLSALWVAGLLMPLAYWYGRMVCRRPRWPDALVAIALLAPLIVVPVSFGFPVTRWPEWLGGIVGISFGWLLARRAPVEPTAVIAEFLSPTGAGANENSLASA